MRPIELGGSSPGWGDADAASVSVGWLVGDWLSSKLGRGCGYRRVRTRSCLVGGRGRSHLREQAQSYREYYYHPSGSSADSNP